MLYYQSNSLMKVVISILPVFLIIFVSAISTSLDGKVYREIGDFLLLIFGFKNGDNSYIGALSMVVFTGIISAVNYLLVRKAPIKD